MLGGNQVCHILQIHSCGHALLKLIGVALLHPIFICGIINDRPLFGRRNLPNIDVQCHTTLHTDMPQECQCFSAGRVTIQGKDAAIGTATDEVICVELHSRGRNHIQKIFGAFNRFLCPRLLLFLF